MEKIIKIFNSTEEAEIKSAFIEMLKDRFKLDLEDMDLYLFDPDNIEMMIKEAFDEVIEEVKIEFRELLKEKLINSIDLEQLSKKIIK